MTDSSTTYREAMEAMGRAVYGDSWQRPLARDLGVSAALVNGAATGSMPFSKSLLAKLADYARIRQVAEWDAYKMRMEALNEACKVFKY